MSVRVHLTGSPEAVGRVVEQLGRHDDVTVESTDTKFETLHHTDPDEYRVVVDVVLSKGHDTYKNRCLYMVCAAIWPSLCWEITDENNKRLAEEQPCQHGNYARDANVWAVSSERASYQHSFKALQGRFNNVRHESLSMHNSPFTESVLRAFHIVTAVNQAEHAIAALKLEILMPGLGEYEPSLRTYELMICLCRHCVPD